MLLRLISLGILALLYGIVASLLWWRQNRLIFKPSSLLWATPEEFGLNYELVWLKIAQDVIHGWWIPRQEPGALTVLYFHGNASNNGDLGGIAAIFNELGLATLLVDYRGYGKSSGKFPTEASVYSDAIAAWEYLTLERAIPPEQILVYGHSLGGAIAIELATKYPHMAGLITEGTFTSIKEMAELNLALKIFPLDLLIHQRFDSINKVNSLAVPWLILHGSEDETVPVFMARKLFEVAPSSTQLEILPQAQHNNLPTFAGQSYQKIVRQFISLATKPGLHKH